MRSLRKATGPLTDLVSGSGIGTFALVATIVLGMSMLAYVASSLLGTVGLIALAGGLVAAFLAAALALRSPVLTFILWLVFLSGMNTVGMIRMPGLPDVSLVRMLMILIMVIMVVGLLFGRSIFRPPLLPDVLLILHTVYILFNAMFVADGSHFNLWYVSNLSPLLGYFFAKQFFDSERHIKYIVYAFALMTVYFWFVSIAEHFKINALIWPKAIIWDMKTRWIGRSRGPFLQPGVFGQLIGTYLMFHFFLLTKKFDRFRYLLISANLALGGVGLFFTYTRGTYLSTVAGLAVMAALRPRYRKAVVAIAVVGVLLAALGPLRKANDETFQDRFSNVETIGNRAGVLYATFQAWKDHPFFGVGFFMFRQQADRYSKGVYAPGLGYVKKKTADAGVIHDQYVGRASEEGLVGMGLWTAMVGAFTWSFRRRWREDPQGEWFNRDMLAVIAGAYTAYLFGGLTYDMRYFGLVNILPFFLAGLVAGFPRRPADAPAPDPRLSSPGGE